MKKTRKVTRVKLQVDQTNDIILLGLVSSDADYKLSLALNKKFGISLKNNSPVKINGDNGTEVLFSRFTHINESDDRSYNLICNRSGKNFLIRKLRNVDYILQVHDPDIGNLVSQITLSLRDISGITAVFNIDIATVKDKNMDHVIQ